MNTDKITELNKFINIENNNISKHAEILLNDDPRCDDIFKNALKLSFYSLIGFYTFSFLAMYFTSPAYDQQNEQVLFVIFFSLLTFICFMMPFISYTKNQVKNNIAESKEKNYNYFIEKVGITFSFGSIIPFFSALFYVQNYYSENTSYLYDFKYLTGLFFDYGILISVGGLLISSALHYYNAKKSKSNKQNKSVSNTLIIQHQSNLNNQIKELEQLIDEECVNFEDIEYLIVFSDENELFFVKSYILKKCDNIAKNSGFKDFSDMRSFNIKKRYSSNSIINY